MPRILSRFSAIAFLCLLIAILTSFFAGKTIGFSEAADRRRQLPDGSILCKPGPWGNLSYIPFNIAAPDELLPVRGIEQYGTHWFLKGFTTDSFVTLLQSTSLTPAQQQAWLDPAILHLQQDGIDLTPSPDLVFSLPADARQKIYQVLAQTFVDKPTAQISFIPADSLSERFSASGVSPDTVALFKQLCVQRGNYLVFSSRAAVLARLPSYDEKLRFLRALSRERTMLLRLHITPDSDIDSLAQYWGKGCWSTDIRTILQSFTTIRNGTWMNILIVLPPLPTSELYYYPTIADNPNNGPPIVRDCHWSSLNFFRDVPDPNFSKPEYVFRELKDNYYPVPGDPRYGDLILITKPDGTLIHSAVYIADDICFTKDGASVTQPWMLSTISDLIQEYSILIPPDQQLAVLYYRDKRP